MREIKFRAWDKTRKEMAHVDLMRWNYPAPAYGWNPKYIKLRYRDETFSREYPIGYESSNPNIIIIQFTGLLDKNGKEIYEGDIIKSDNLFVGDKLLVVGFQDGCFIAKRKEIGLKNIYEQKIEVIGNIYENKDLLK